MKTTRPPPVASSAASAVNEVSGPTQQPEAHDPTLLREPALPPGPIKASSQKPIATTPVQLAGRPLPPVTTERFTLADAVGRADFTARDPAQIRVPPQLLDAVRDADTVLLVGHVGPDGDCVGSTLAMARALRLVGKEVDVCIDDELSGFLRQIDTDKEIKRPRELSGRDWDLALVMDVGVPERIGDVNEALLPHAGTVAIADHHVVDPSADDFCLAPHATFIRWVEPDFPAATLQAAAILGRLDATGGASADERAEVYLPALAGFATDTGWGTYQGFDREYFRYFKHMLIHGATATMGELGDWLNRFALPPRLMALLLGEPVEGELPPALAEALACQAREGRGIVEKTWPAREGDAPGLGVLTCSAEHMATLLEVGRLDDPDLIDSDLLAPLKQQRIEKLRDAGVPLTALLRDTPEGNVRVSLRSSTDAARRLATALGGGGHDRAAGATVHGASLGEVRDRIAAWAKREGVI